MLIDNQPVFLCQDAAFLLELSIGQEINRGSRNRFQNYNVFSFNK